MNKNGYKVVLVVSLMALLALGATVGGLSSAAEQTGEEPLVPFSREDISSRSAPAWITSTVDLVDGCMYQDVSLAFDAEGQPHISYLNSKHWDLMYATLEDSNWITDTVDQDGIVGQVNAIALDSRGYPHNVYRINEPYMDSRLRYAHWDGNQWLIETVSDESGIVYYSSLAIDAQDRVHLAFQHDAKVEYGRDPGPLHEWPATR